MAVSRNFVVKNGLQVNTSLLFADVDNQRIGIGSTQPNNVLDVVGGIAATDIQLSGFATAAQFSGPSGHSAIVGSGLSVAGITTLAGSGGITTTGGDLYVGGDLYINDDLVFDEVSGRELYISGLGTINQFTAMTANVSGSATVTGNLEVGGNLDVTGDITYDEVSGRNLNITGIATAVQQFNVGTGGTVFYVEEQGSVNVGSATTGASFLVNGGSVPSIGLVIALGG